MTVSLAYRGLHVSDLAVSAHFYEGLGFREIGRGTGSQEMLQLRNAQGITLQLTRLAVPDRRSPRPRRPMTALGLTHLNFYVRDYEGTLRTVRKRGGTVAEETLIATETMSMIYCTDPDGIRVEVWSTTPYGTSGFSAAVPGVDHKFSHSGICVRDLQESMAFYQRLGFTPAEVFDYRDPPGQLDPMFEETGSRALAQMMRNGSDVVELLAFLHPQPGYQAEWAASGRAAFDLLAFQADSQDEVAGKGSDPKERRDPNGVRIAFLLPNGTARKDGQ